MPRPYNSSFTMFVYLKGHHLLEYYFALSDTRMSANDLDSASHTGGVSAASPSEPRRWP
jgi:hypothetical protein